jgi:hypothetical protein
MYRQSNNFTQTTNQYHKGFQSVTFPTFTQHCCTNIFGPFDWNTQEAKPKITQLKPHNTNHTTQTTQHKPHNTNHTTQTTQHKPHNTNLFSTTSGQPKAQI